MTCSLNIGIVAYGLDPSKVFVRVPNEKGRWMMVDRCVVEVDCPYCRAVAGEPCRARTGNQLCGEVSHDPIRYHVGVHVARREAWQTKTGLRFPAKRAEPYKIHIRAEEMVEVTTPAQESE